MGKFNNTFGVLHYLAGAKADFTPHFNSFDYNDGNCMVTQRTIAGITPNMETPPTPTPSPANLDVYLPEQVPAQSPNILISKLKKTADIVIESFRYSMLIEMADYIFKQCEFIKEDNSATTALRIAVCIANPYLALAILTNPLGQEFGLFASKTLHGILDKIPSAPTPPPPKPDKFDLMEAGLLERRRLSV